MKKMILGFMTVIAMGSVANASPRLAYKAITCANTENGMVYRLDFAKQTVSFGQKVFGRAWDGKYHRTEAAQISIKNDGPQNTDRVIALLSRGKVLEAFFKKGVLQNGAKDRGEDNNGVGSLDETYLLCSAELSNID